MDNGNLREVLEERLFKYHTDREPYELIASYRFVDGHWETGCGGEVVRCRKCKYAVKTTIDIDGFTMDFLQCSHCKDNQPFVEYDHFCGYGEKG